MSLVNLGKLRVRENFLFIQCEAFQESTRRDFALLILLATNANLRVGDPLAFANSDGKFHRWEGF